MSHDYQAVHALDGRVSARSERHANHVAVHHSVAIAQVLAAPASAVEAAAILVADGAADVRFVGPGEWIVISRTLGPDALAEALSARLGDFAFVVDRSSGRVLLALSGPDIRRILANGIAVDLHPDTFPVGRSANALCNHVAVNLARTGEDDFELIVTRSFAGALLDDLRLMARGHALSVGFSD